MYVCSLSYPACNAHAPVVTCDLPGCTIFFHIISQTARFSKNNVIEQKVVLRFSLQLRRNDRDMIKIYIGLHVKHLYTCEILTKLEFSGEFFEKYSNIKFHENPSSGRRVFPCGRTDRQTDGQT